MAERQQSSIPLARTRQSIWNGQVRAERFQGALQPRAIRSAGLYGTGSFRALLLERGRASLFESANQELICPPSRLTSLDRRHAIANCGGLPGNVSSSSAAGAISGLAQQPRGCRADVHGKPPRSAFADRRTRCGGHARWMFSRDLFGNKVPETHDDASDKRDAGCLAFAPVSRPTRHGTPRPGRFRTELPPQSQPLRQLLMIGGETHFWWCPLNSSRSLQGQWP